MIDMKLTPEQSQTMSLLEGDIEGMPAYPEGLKLELEGEALKRMAMGAGNLPPVGQRFVLLASVEVVEVCKEEGAMDTDYCVELQIQQMELTKPEMDMHDRIDQMYAPV
jgi:hypothetical protein